MPILNTLSSNLFPEQVKLNKKNIDSDLENVIQNINFKISEDYTSEIQKVIDGGDSDILKKKILSVIDRDYKDVVLKRDLIQKKCFEYLLGYRFLEEYVTNEKISDIVFTRWNYCTIKKNGKVIKTNLSFRDEVDFQNFAILIIRRLGGIIDANNTHCRVPDPLHRLRINVTISPRSQSGPTLIIRKHPLNPDTLDELQEKGMLNEKQKIYLRERGYRLDKNVFFGGKGGSGKTTLLRAMLMKADSHKLVLVSEKDTELYLNNSNIVTQRIKKEEEKGKPVTLRTLVRDGLTMSLDAYVVGEVVGQETLELLEAGTTGHNIYTTFHVNVDENSVENLGDAFVQRMFTLIDMSDMKVTEKTIKRIIANAVDIIVFMKDFKVDKIIELIRYDEVNDRFLFKDITDIQHEGVN